MHWTAYTRVDCIPGRKIAGPSAGAPSRSVHGRPTGWPPGYNPAVLRAAAIFLLACACATVPDGVTPDAPIVEALRIEGAKAVSEAELKEKILTAESSSLPLVGQTHYFDANAWQADLRRIERFYQARGYYQAKVVAEEVDVTRPGRVSLYVRVEEGEPTFLTKVDVSGLEKLPPEHRDEVLKALPLKVGDVFLEEKWTGLKRPLTQRLHQLGYAEANVLGEVQIDVDARSAEVRLEAQPGQRYRFGKLYVDNPGGKVSRDRIAEQASQAIRPGDWYSESALVDAQARVFAMGVFGAVKVTRSAPERELGIVPVIVAVREAPFHTNRLGFGFGVDQTRQEVRATGEYINRNVRDRLWRYTFRGKASYAVLPSALAVARREPGAKQGPVLQLLNELEVPRLIGPTVNFHTSLDLKNGIEPTYEFIGGTAKAGLIWKPRTDLAIFPSLNLDAYWLSAQLALQDRPPSALLGCTTCVLPYFEQTVEWDRRDSPLEPRQGFYAALSLQQSAAPGQGGVPFPLFFRFQPELRGYVSFLEGKRLTLSAKLKLGTILKTHEGPETPIIARFFSGGGSSMRGFNTRRLSPLVPVPVKGEVSCGLDAGPECQKQPAVYTTLPVGGDALFESSFEVRYALNDDWVLAAFLDAGFVTYGAYQVGDLDYFLQNVQVAVGLGARWRTPIGPLRFDVAYRVLGGPLRVLQDPSAVPSSNSCAFGLLRHPGTQPPEAGLQMDRYPGSPDSFCAFHVSIGEAF